VARENIRLQEGNFTTDGTYFYSLLDGSQTLQQKVDDGSVAFTYPLDTAVGGNVTELVWDGVYFWSLETKSGGLIVRKWGVESFICQQQQQFDFNDNATHTYSATAFALEHYRLTAGDNDNGAGGYTVNMSSVHLSDNTMLEAGDVLTFVRKDTSAASRFGTSNVEQVTVQTTVSGSTTQVNLTAPMTGDPHNDGKGFRGPTVAPGASEPATPDEVFVTKFLWLNNNNAPSAVGTPALYKVRASSGANIVQYAGTQFDSIGGNTFYTKYVVASGIDVDNTLYNTTVVTDANNGGRQTYLLMARGSSLLFYNTTTNIVDRSFVMNNIKADTINTWPVYDMEVVGMEPDVILFRLQLGTTYKNESLTLVNTTWSTYNYEKQVMRPVVNSIAVVADPSIIPANGITSFSTITATVRDQYNNVVSGKTVEWSEDSGHGTGDGGSGLASATSETNALGRATNTYYAGTTEQDVKITAAITNGIV
jgi:hypothetical protein